MIANLKQGVTAQQISLHITSDEVGNLGDFFYIMSMLFSGHGVKFHHDFGTLSSNATPVDNKCNIPKSWLVGV